LGSDALLEVARQSDRYKTLSPEISPD
jgi:hypothetical protein